MTVSFGENELNINSRIIGRIRVLGVHRGHALFPRLSFRLGVSLQESSTEVFAPGRPIQNFEVRDLRGELRLEEMTKVVGTFEWLGPRRFVRSAAYHLENQVEVACDLDWARLEAIEEHRQGNELVMWLALWPAVIDASGFLDCDARVVRAVIPRDTWLRVLGELTGLRRTVVEVLLPSVEGPEFKAAVGHIEEARTRLDRGDLDESVAACRRAVETLLLCFDVRDATALEAKLSAITDARRAKAYAGIVSRLKELGNFTIHRSEAPGIYIRAEARFAVALASHLLELLATLLRSTARE